MSSALKSTRRESRRGVAGIVATVVMFAILFTVGTSYFIFVGSQNSSYVSNLLSATNKVQGNLAEGLSIGALLDSTGNLEFYANNTSSETVNMTAVLIISSTGALLSCEGVGFPAGAGCGNTTPTLWQVVTPGSGSPDFDTEYAYVTGTTLTLKVLTARGNSYSTTYPQPASQSSASQSVTVNLDNLKWVQLIPQASSLVQTKYVSNCNAANCAASFTSNVGSGNILVDAISWPNHSPPSTPTDTLSDHFTLGASASVTVPTPASVVQNRYTSNCNAASCGLAFSSSVTSGNTLVYAVGWANQAAPSAPTDTRGDSFTLGASQSVTVNPPTPTVVQHRYLANCSSATCALAYSSTVTAGNTLVLGLGWPSTQQYNYVPVTISNCQLQNSLGVDGSTTAGSGGSATNSQTTGTLTTTHTNDVIVVIASLSDGSGGSGTSNHVSSVTGTGLTFTLRTAATNYVNPTYYADVEEWTAIASSTFSNTITVNTSGTFRFTVVAFGISGANTSSPFDANAGANPTASGTSNAPSVTQSTSNANDMLIAGLAVSQNPGTINTYPTGYTNVADVFTGGGGSQAEGSSDYNVVTATTSAASVSYALSSSSNSWVMLADAFQAASASCASGLGIDGSNSNECDGATSCTLSLTTSNSNDVIYASVSDSAGGNILTSFTDSAGLTWHQRQLVNNNGNSIDVYTYYAIASSPVSSDTITWQNSASANMRGMVIGVSGANLAAPFDPNLSTAPSASGSSSTMSVTVTTTNANDIIIGAGKSNGGTVTSGASGYTATFCCSSQYFGFEYKIVSSTGSYTPTFGLSSSGAWSEIGDAIEAAPATATPNPFQEMVAWNPSTYSTYESSTLSNVRFCSDSACATPLDAWLESCLNPTACSSSSTSATAWVKLTSAISSGSSLTIYLVFEGTSVNFDSNYWGEAPTLSGTYGQYDNGANVFNFYDNFAGTTLSGTKWQTVLYGGGSISVNNGLTISASSNTYNPMLVSKNKQSPGVLDEDLSLSSEQTAQSTPTIFYATTLPTTSGGDYGFQTAYRFDWAPYSSLFRSIADVTGSYAAGTTAGYTLPSTYNIWSATWGATGSESFTFNYASQYVWTDSHITYGSAYFGTSGVQGGTVNEYWLRLRAVPPNNVMPASSFGTLTTGTGSPTSVSDTLGDSFTQAVAQSAVSGSTAYESAIWYATASGSGSNTITATFSASIAGSVSIYEIAGYSTNGVLTSTGSSTGGSTSASVGSFTPNTNSFAVGNVETGSASTKYTVGTGYTTVATGGGGCDASDASQGCSEYETGLGSATTTPFTLSASTPWVDIAAAFTPLTSNTYYSYLWYATAGSSGADTISANFGSTVAGSVSIYEISGVTATGLLSQTGSSASSQSATAVTSMTPTAGSVVIGNAESTSTTYTAGSGYTLSGTCSTVPGCGEYQTGVGSATTVPLSISPSAPWVEVAVAFAPTTTNYYSYIWYATAATSGADTVTAAFGSTVTGSVSLYEITGYTTSGVLSSTGSSTTSSTTSGVTSYTPATDSFTLGAVESPTSLHYTAGSGFTLVATCNPVYGCSEYNAGGGGSASTVPMTLGTSAPWVEASLSFSTPFNQQSGIQVNGYPTMGVSSGASLAWEVTFTNVDPLHRPITIWPQTELAIGSAEYDGFDTDYTQAHYYIIDGLNSGSTTVTAYTKTSGSFITLAYNVPTTLYFAATAALGSTTQAFGTNVLTPFEAYFALTGIFSDGTLFGETIPYPYGIITQASAYTTPTSGATGNTVTVSCTSPCHFTANAKGLVEWINSAGQMTQVTTFTMSGSGNIPSGVTFQVPSVAAGYYTIEVTDYINSVFMTFQHT